jgi:hypothetical protein
MEGESFEAVLQRHRTSFYNFFSKMTDVVNVHLDQMTKTIMLTRVSGNCASSHMDNLTVNKYSKRHKGLKVTLSANNVPRVTITRRPASTSYPTSFNRAPMRVNYNFHSGHRSVTPNPHFRPAASTYGTSSAQKTATYNPTYKPRSVVSPMQRSFVHDRTNPSTNKLPPRFQQNVAHSRANVPTVVYPRTNVPTVVYPGTPARPSSTAPSTQTTAKTAPVQNTSSTASTLQHRLNLAKENHPPIKQKEEKPVSIKETPPQAQADLTKNNDDEYEDFDWTDMSSTSSSTCLSVKSIPVEIRLNAPSVPSLPKSPLREITQAVNKITIQSDAPPSTKKREAPVELRSRLTSLRLFQQALVGIDSAGVAPSSQLRTEFDSPSQMPAYQYGDKAFFDIKIFDVDSPSRFSFQYSLSKLEDMMAKMNRHYNNLRNLSGYQVEVAEIGMLVAVRDDKNRWCRAEIRETTFNKIAVRFIDYLTVTKRLFHVSFTDIYHLANEFAKESPKSAIGRLHGVKPKQEFWCLNSKLEVMNSRDDVMKATIKKYQDEVFALTIIVNGEDFLRMSDYMIDQEYADEEPKDYTDLSPKGQRSLVSTKVMRKC